MKTIALETIMSKVDKETSSVIESLEVIPMADITIQIPDELLLALGKTPEERTELVLRALALECFQVKRWPTRICGELMGTSRAAFIELQMERGIPNHLTGRDLFESYEIMEKLSQK